MPLLQARPATQGPFCEHCSQALLDDLERLILFCVHCRSDCWDKYVTFWSIV